MTRQPIDADRVRPAVVIDADRVRPAVVIAAGVTVCLWASAFVGIRYAGRHFQPGPLALGRLLVGSVALGAIVLVRRQALPPRRALAGIAVCGVMWFGLYNVALNAAERHLDAGIAALLVNVGPIFIAILAGALLKEGFPRLLLVGCVVSFAGAAADRDQQLQARRAARVGTLSCASSLPWATPPAWSRRSRSCATSRH